MKLTREWLKFFNISDEMAMDWLKEAKSAENFTFWCLKNKKIKNSDYLKWAQNYYQLPILKSEYFLQPTDNSWWDIVRSISNWSENFIPIVEWDNTIFIACIEPRSDIHWSFPVCYLLASSTDLEKRWKELNSQVKKEATAPAPAPTPAAPVSATTPALSSPQKNIQKDLSSPTLTDTPTRINLQPQAALNVSEGLTGNSKPTTDAPAGLNSDAPAGLNLDAPAGLNLDAPAGLNLDAPAGLNLDAPAGLNLDAPAGLNLDAPAGLKAPEGLTENSTPKTEAPAGLNLQAPAGLNAETPAGLSVSPKTTAIITTLHMS